MEKPENDIHKVLNGLCKADIAEQTTTISTYFLPDAAFEHPYCRVPSFADRSILGLFTLNSRWVILMIYRLYRMLSPNIDLHVESCVFDKRSGILYVNLWQTFSVWFIPFYNARVHLVSVITLEAVDQSFPETDWRRSQPRDGSSRSKDRRYLIKSQQDYYQLNDILKFVLLWVGSLGCHVWQLFSSVCCVIVASFSAPLYFLLWPSWQMKRKVS